ncbi:MAG: YfhO family protein, partial [Bacteroidaceae bacterium]|nr:YfhO family protein [Bacteroidaceae bacterium]
MKHQQFIKKDFVKLFLIISIIVLVVFAPYIFFKRPFILVNDQIFQFNLYYREWTNLIKDLISDGTMPFYSWYKFLGSDFYSSNALYTIGDVFYPILLILFRNLEKALLFETIIMIYISAYTMFCYIKQRSSKSELIAITFAVLYSISGTATLYFGNYMFHRFYAFMPLLFLGVDNWIKNNKGLLFTFATFFLLIQNYYLMFIVSAFLPIYFKIIYRENLKEPFNLILYFKSALKLILFYLLGFMISAILLVPSILNLLNNQRLGNDSYGLFWELRVILGYVFSFLAGPFPTYTYFPNMFYSGYNGHAYWYSMYISSSLLFVLIGGLFSKSSLVRKKSIQFWLLSLVILFVLPISSLFHGFSEPSMRVSLPLIFFSITCGNDILNLENLKSIKKGFYAYLVIFIIAAIVALLSGIYEDKHYIQAIYLLISLIFSYFLVLLINVSNKKILVILIIVESVMHSFLAMQILNRGFYWHNPNFTQSYLDYYQDIDEERMYRIYVNPKNLMPSSVLNLNQSLQYRFMTTTTYDSMYEPELSDFLNWIGFDWHIIDIKNPIIQTLLGVKYYLGFDNGDIPYPYSEYIYSIDHYNVYKNPYYLGMGFTYSSFINNSMLGDDIDWLNELILDDTDYEYFKDMQSSERKTLDIYYKSGNGFVAGIENQVETILFISIPSNKGGKAYDNGELMQIMKVQGGFIGVYLAPGYHELNFSFVPYGFKTGALITLIGSIIYGYLFIIKKQKDKDNS